MILSAKEIIDNKIEEIGARMENDTFEMADTSFLEFLLANKTLSEEEIYTNTTEVLLSGADTVSTICHNYDNIPIQCNANSNSRKLFCFASDSISARNTITFYCLFLEQRNRFSY